MSRSKLAKKAAEVLAYVQKKDIVGCRVRIVGTKVTGVVAQSYKHHSWHTRLYLVYHDPNFKGIVLPDAYYRREDLVRTDG